MKTQLWIAALGMSALLTMTENSHAQNAAPPSPAPAPAPSVIPTERRHPDELNRGDERIQEDRSRYGDPLNLGSNPGIYVQPLKPQDHFVGPKQWAKPEDRKAAEKKEAETCKICE